MKLLSAPKLHSWLCTQLLCNDSTLLWFIFLCVLEVSDTSSLGYVTILIQLPFHMLTCCSRACPSFHHSTTYCQQLSFLLPLEFR